MDKFFLIYKICFSIKYFLNNIFPHSKLRDTLLVRKKTRRYVELKSSKCSCNLREYCDQHALLHVKYTITERDRHKPTPPPKPAALVAGQYVYRDLALTPEMYNQLRGLQKKAKDLRQEVRNLRRMSQAQAHTVRETIKDTFITIRYCKLSEKINYSRF